MAEKRHHDMGGEPAGEIDVTPHELPPWQKQAWAMRQVLGDKKRRIVRTDELRRAIEDLPPSDYDTLEYFERWVMATHNLVVEKGVLTAEEIVGRVAELKRKRAEEV